MEHVKYDLGQLKSGSTVVITLRNQANVLLMDDSNYRTYAAERGGGYSYQGGLAKKSPVRIMVPRDGRWTLAIDLGGASGTINAGVSVEPPPRGSLPALQDPPPLSAIRHALQTETPPEASLGGRSWDVFLSDASEDKGAVVRPLATELERLGVSVWLDEVYVRIGDSLRRKIDDGIRSSRFATVVFSSSFFAKGWTQYELDGIVTRTAAVEQNLLPIWHNVTKDEVMSFSPSLADKVARNTATSTIRQIAQEIAAVVTGDVAP